MKLTERTIWLLILERLNKNLYESNNLTNWSPGAFDAVTGLSSAALSARITDYRWQLNLNILLQSGDSQMGILHIFQRKCVHIKQKEVGLRSIH